ncbi:MAG: FliO/MopB family protein [Alphaproteobacteria bacterium]|nr:FliO/MopB family protein [Alphaproteobacteria bacterium]MBF0251308.1 FliO/MopB family protein [Alphaproteobacteria bacterium]
MNMDMENYIQFILALAFVLGLIGLLATLARRWGLGVSTHAMRRGGERRLALVEILPLDAKRRAVLIRRDDLEHLVVLGPDSATVVETAIPVPPAKPAGDAPAFAQVLGKTKTTPQEASQP